MPSGKLRDELKRKVQQTLSEKTKNSAVEEFKDGPCPTCGKEASGYALQMYGQCDSCEYHGWHGVEIEDNRNE